MQIFVPGGRFTVSGSKFFNFFLFSRTFLASFDGSISISPSLGFLWMVAASISSRMLSSLDSNSLSLTLGGMPKISRHSLLKYCSFAKLFLSTLVSLSGSLELTFLDMFRSAYSLVNLVLSSSKLYFKSSRTELNLPW